MSWAGVLELVQQEATQLLTSASDTANVERKYLLTVSTLLDEEHARHIVEQRTSSGLCASWLCTHRKAAAPPSVAPADDNETISKRSNSKDNCCCAECGVALFHLMKRAKEFDPTSQQVTEALFKLFPNARDNIDKFAALKRQEQEAKLAQRKQDAAADTAQPPAAAEAAAAAGAESASSSESNTATIKKNKQQDPDGPLPGSNSAAIHIRERLNPTAAKAPTNTNRPGESSSLLFSALDPRIAVVVLTDLLLPQTLKRRWTKQLAANFNDRRQNHLSTLWLEALPGGPELLSQCTARAAALASSDGAQKAKDEDEDDTLIPGHHHHPSPADFKSMMDSGRKDTILAAHNSFRSREIASEVLSSLMIGEARRCALLLRLDCEIPMEFGSKLDELMTSRFSIPTPVPYEDSKDTWLLFTAFLYCVLSLTDGQLALRLGERPPKALSEIMNAFCIDPARAREILFCFFETD